MKHVILTIMVIAVAGMASAQIEKGSWLLGANSALGYTSYTPVSGSSSSTTVSSMNIGCKAGYFAAPGFAIGINLDYLNLSQGSSSSFTTIGIFIRHYGNHVFFGAGYNSISTSGGSDSYGSIPLELGYVAFITRNLAIEPALGYSFATDPDKGGLPGVGGIPFPAKSALGLKIGFTLFLGRGEASTN